MSGMSSSQSFSRKSERYTSEGGISGEAVIQNLGRPRLDAATILVREAVQNSWDARSDRENGSIEINIELRSVTTPQLKLLRHTVFADRPRAHPLEQFLQEDMKLLVIQDKGTSGLNGPIFHQKRSDPDQPRNFIRFIRQVGRGAHRQLGGGTYGFGKSIFYAVSGPGTCLVYTCCPGEGRGHEHRLIAHSITRPSDDETLTGRHWWGLEERAGIAPLQGTEAKNLAKRLGLPVFKAGETGTTIAILAPRLSDEMFKPGDGGDLPSELDSGELMVRYLAETAMCWYWPRMLSINNERPSISFCIRHEGTEVALPDPEREPPFKWYAKAFRNLLASRSEDSPPSEENGIHKVETRRPKARLGLLALNLAEREKRRRWIAADVEGHPLREQLVFDSEDETRGRYHHVALMRFPWQVVRYLRCRPSELSGLNYTGVFLVDGDSSMVEEAFAQAEPPTHDDWIPDVLEDPQHRSIIRVGLREIHKFANAFVAGQEAVRVPSVDDSLEQIAVDLGGLMLVNDPWVGRYNGNGDKTKKPNKRPSSMGKPQLYLIDQGQPQMIDGQRSLVFTFDISGHIPVEGIQIQAFPRVVVIGGANEHTPPDRSVVPEVIRWIAPDGLVREGGNMVEIDSEDQSTGHWTVAITVPQDAMVGLGLAIQDREVRGEGEVVE
jgi:hypothetical protein